ncbi:hypothetical protein FACS189492_1660 [Clostridia bacterium]|nr:hypothetical protein FACS189492_1660 [Clostridia bacterium]
MTAEINTIASKLWPESAAQRAVSMELIGDIVAAKIALDTATQNFEFAVGDDLVDLYSFRIIEAQTKYNMLLRRAKAEGLSNPDYIRESLRVRRK